MPNIIAPLKKSSALTALTPEQEAVVDMAMAKQFAGRIKATWTTTSQNYVTGIVKVGSLLVEARDTLDHGCFGSMIKDKLPFGPRTGQMLMCIAEHPVISNANHGSHLPPCWRTLYELTKIPNEILLAKIEDGTINPALERKDVAKLIAKPPAQPEEAHDKMDYEEWLSRCQGDLLPSEPPKPFKLPKLRDPARFINEQVDHLQVRIEACLDRLTDERDRHTLLDKIITMVAQISREGEWRDDYVAPYDDDGGGS